MFNIFSPVFLTIGAFGLLFGAALGEYAAHKVPHQRLFIALALYACLAVSVFAGADVGQLMDGALASAGDGRDGFNWYVARQIFLFGLVSGAALFMIRRSRGSQVYGACLTAAVGLPLMMNIWYGAGMTYASNSMAM